MAKVIVDKIKQAVVIKSVTLILTLEEATLIASVFGGMTTTTDSELDRRASGIYDAMDDAGLGYPYEYSRPATMTGRLEWRGH